MPVLQSNAVIYTYADVVEHLLDLHEVDRTATLNQRNARRAILNAYRDLPQKHPWSYYYRQRLLQTAASYSTGTVSYDHCVTPDHEALTRDGWKTYESLNVGDEILAYDHDTETCSWQAIEALHVFDYSGDVLEVERKGRTVLRCTPNHRIPVYERHGHGHGTPRGYRKKWVLAKDLTDEQFTPLSAPLAEETTGPLTARQAAILGWTVTDGHNAFGKWKTARICQSSLVNGDKCEEIASLTNTIPHVSKNGMHSYAVPREDSRHIRTLASSKTDLVPLFCRFGVQQAEAAVRAMLLAEGSTHPVNDQRIFSQWGNNKPVAEAFQVACLLTGRAVNISTGEFNCRAFGREYERKVRYQCPVRKANRIKLKRYSKWVKYSGKVWCPQVKTTAWVMRCNGAVMITGNSGGANERQVTLTTGTWPSWAAFGRIIIDDVHYEVDSRVSDSIITLKEDSNPGADVAADTTYQLYRAAYPLPVNFKRMGRIWDIDGGRALPYVDQQEQHDGSVYFFDTPQTPWQYTIRNNGDYYGSLQLVFGPPPNALLSYDMLYEVTPRPLAIDYYATGTVEISGTTCTLTTGTWPSNCAGSILRVSSGASAPTNLVGSLSADNPFASQHVIKSRTSDSVVVLEESGGTVASGKGFTLSDPIDVEPGAMLNAFLRMCEAEFCRTDNRKDAEARRELAHLAIIEAKEADQRVLPANFNRLYDYFKHGEITTE